MNFARLEARVCGDEGFRSAPYLDTVGVPTIGYGTTSILGRKVTLADDEITESTARHLLRSDLYQACNDAQSLFVRFDDMDDVRQEVLVNAAYNMGKTRLGMFTKLLHAAEILNYPEMAAQLKDSKWFGQVGQRGERLFQAMLHGAW